MQEILYENQHDRNQKILVWKQHKVGTVNHIHNSLEFIYVIKGSICATVGNLEGTAEAGEMLLIASYTPHCLESKPDGEYLCLQIPTEKIELSPALVSESTFENLMLKDTDSELIKRLLLVMHEIGDNKNDAIEKDETQLKFFANAFFSIVTKECRFVKRSSPITLVSNIASFIIDHYKEDISVRSIAKSLFCNQQQMSLRFREVMKISIPEYINTLRLSYAKSLLVDSHYRKLDEIAAMSGFNSTRLFLKNFKEMYGCTPTEMRNRAK